MADRDVLGRWKAALPNIVGGQRQLAQETIDRIEQLERERQWIPVARDTLPDRDAGEVLAVISGRHRTCVIRDARWVRAVFAEAVENDETCAITHWMPIPELK